MVARVRLSASMTILILALISGATTALPQDDKETQAGFTDLTFQISAPKEQFIRLEPIPVIFKLSNPTTKPIKVSTAFVLGTNYVRLFVRGADEEVPRVHNHSSESILIAPGARTIRPNEDYVADQLLVLGLGEMFPRAGAYYVQVALYDEQEKKTLRSNELKLEIVGPRGIDSSAFNYLTNNVNPYNFFEGVIRSSPEKAEEFALLFGESAYGDYAVYMLGRYYWLHDKYAEAGKHFEKLSKKTNFFYAGRVKHYLSKIKEKQKGSEPVSN